MKIQPRSTVLMGVLLMSAVAEAGPEKAIRSAVSAFAHAGDVQSADQVAAVTDPEFRVVFQMAGAPGTTVLDRATYMKMLTDKKLGGKERSLRIEQVHVDGELATVRHRMKRADAEFSGVLTLVRTSDGWKVIQDAVRLTKR